MNDIEILEEFIEQYNASYPEEKECVAIYPNQIEAISSKLPFSTYKLEYMHKRNALQELLEESEK